MRADLRISLWKARLAQKLISSKVVLRDSFRKPLRFIGGVDAAFSREKMVGAAVVLSYPELRMIEHKVVKAPIKVPYIPTYLAFREAPVMMKAVKSLKLTPDLLFVDANGILHPLRVGEASHIGVVLDIPTIGVAKSLLCGEVREVEGKRVVLLDGEAVGFEVKIGGKTIYISPGHKISLESSLKYTLSVVRKGQIVPLKQAHSIASKARQID